MKKFLSLAMAAVLSLSFTACGGGTPAEQPSGGGSGSTASSGSDTTQVKTDFKFITAMSDRERTNVLNTAIDKLKEKYPNVTFINESNEDYNNTAKLAFSSGDGYSLVLTDDLGITALRDAGYLLDLSEYIKERGWDNKQLEGATEFYNQRSPGKSYTVGMNYAPVVAYYNKDIFQELNLEIPTTLDQFENVLKVATENGYIGSENCKDNINGWYIQDLVQNLAPFEDVLNWYYLEESSDKMKNAFIEAGEIVKKWSDAGYFRKDYMGIEYGDVPSLFGLGQSAVSFDGNWMLSEYENCGVNIGIFVLPGVKNSSDPNYIINPVDGAWAVGKQVNETQLAVALDFIDIMLTQEMGEMWLGVGALPSLNADFSQSNTSPLTKELLEAITTTHSGFYLDNVKPGYLDVMIKNIQLFLMGDQTSTQMWDSLDAEWHNQ